MRAPAPRGRRGFTVIEALTALLVVATVTRIALPEIHELLKAMQAKDVAEAVETVRGAAERFREERGRWPEDARTGEVPPDLTTYLPDGFRFDGAGYRLDWERWSLPDGLPDAPAVRGLVGVTVVTPDTELGLAVTERLGDRTAAWRLDDRWTLLFDRIP